MSKINVDTWEPESGTAATLMASGDTVTMPSGAELDIASGATLDVNGTIDVTGATTTGFPSSGFNKYTVVVASDATFDLQSGTTKLIIEVQASGGNAGNTSSPSGYTGGLGGGGAYAMKLLSPMVDTDTLNITIGAVAGVAGSGTTTSVASASGTSFTTITCDGGNGGITGVSSYGVGGVGGDVPTTGDFNIAGGNGSGATAQTQEGQGGAWMARSNYSTDNTLGLMSTGYGGGGGGRGVPGSTGAAGGPAVVIVWEYK